jgi:hypothetical protein
MSTALRLVRTCDDAVPAELQGNADATLFQSPDWIRFLQASQGAEPVYADVLDGDRRVGRFNALLTRRFGVRMLGSPLPGWTTPYMGFNLQPDVSRLDALEALITFADKDLRCAHVELMDRNLDRADAGRSGLRHRFLSGFEIDLTRSEQDLWEGMSSACRRCVRKSERVGISLEVAEDEAFVDDYYAQAVEVFGKQGLAPTYPKSRVALLVETMLPTGRLLLVRARDEAGACIATGIFPAGAGSMYFWGGASRLDRQILRPNEAVQWFAMRYWKARGAARYDMGGGGEYKRKYGGSEITVPWLRWSRYEFLESLRTAAQAVHKVRQRRVRPPTSSFIARR